MACCGAGTQLEKAHRNRVINQAPGPLCCFSSSHFVSGMTGDSQHLPQLEERSLYTFKYDEKCPEHGHVDSQPNKQNRSCSPKDFKNAGFSTEA